MIESEMLKARILVNRTRLYGRLVDLLHAFDLEDLSGFTPEQRITLRRARELIDMIQKGGPL